MCEHYFEVFNEDFIFCRNCGEFKTAPVIENTPEDVPFLPFQKLPKIPNKIPNNPYIQPWGRATYSKHTCL